MLPTSQFTTVERNTPYRYTRVSPAAATADIAEGGIVNWLMHMSLLVTVFRKPQDLRSTSAISPQSHLYHGVRDLVVQVMIAVRSTVASHARLLIIC